MSYPLDRKLAVEFIGMFLFLFTVGLATESANKSGAVLAPLAIGSVLMVIVFAGGHVSGGHYNPAVSTAVFLRGKITSSEHVAYVLTQFVAAVLAGLLVTVVGGKETAGSDRQRRQDVGRRVSVHLRARLRRAQRRDREGNRG